VRTLCGHADGELFSLRRMLTSLRSLQNRQWRAFIADNNVIEFEGLEELVASFEDPRIVLIPRLPVGSRAAFDPHTNGFPYFDAMLQQHCLGGAAEPAEWLMVTNGDNFYTPDALNLLPQGADMVLMNFYGRFSLTNSFAYTGAGQGGCCSRLASYTCTTAAPTIGRVDLGAMVVRRSSWVKAGLNFSMFTGACEYSCHDGALAQHVDRVLGWSIATHPIASCAFFHNPNPEACRLVGGIYFDSEDWREAGCYDAANLPLPLGEVDWDKFTQEQGCVCKRSGAPAESAGAL